MTAFSTRIEPIGIAVVTFDLPGEPVNKLATSVARELETTFAGLFSDPAVRAIVLISGKPDTFIAGADIEEFTRIRTPDEAEQMSREGQAMLDRIEQSAKPVVAAIHGACVGGGCELVLACHYRIATDHAKTQIGLPEVQLGIIPGLGGTQRLPRLIGARAALDIILAGKSERAAKAYKIGLVDELVAPSILRQTAIAAADRLAHEGRPKQERKKTGAAGAFLDDTALGRKIVYSQARKTVLKKTGGHYPAPLAALEAVRMGLEQGLSAGYALEHRKFGELAVSDVSRKLVQIFFATTALKKDDGVAPGTATPREVTRVGVIGSGFMGAGIAGTAVTTAGVEVRLKDAELGRVGKGLKAAMGIIDGRLKRRRITRPEHQRLTGLLSGSADYQGFRHADIVVEAVFEDLDVKRNVLAEVEGSSGTSTIFATNTSTIPIGQIAARAARPDRVLGMHFFSPVDRMPLLEVIPTEHTSAESIVTTVNFGRRMGKTVIVVGDRPGFWVNRILSPYMNEAGLLLEEGAPIDIIDRVMTKFGFPVGPVTLLDEVGLDVGLKAGKVMYEAFGARLEPSGVVGKMIADNRMGRKNGRGFYVYVDGKKTGVDDKAYAVIGAKPVEDFDKAQIERRLVYSMLNEAAMAAGEGVVRSARDGDIGAIFGIGFPPFRGGPLRMIDDLGATSVVKTLEGLAAAHGPRFVPCSTLIEMGKNGRAFYPA